LGGACCRGDLIMGANYEETRLERGIDVGL
jgi:hypothetical protein